MASDRGVPKYSRQDLRKATRFTDGDYRGINPREFYRRLKRRLEEIQTKNDFKYETVGTQDSDLDIISEEVGQKTGRLDGRLMAESDWGMLGTGKIEYKPYGPHGALMIVIGLLVAVATGLAEELVYAALGGVLVVAGIYLYFKTETGEFPVARKDIIRILMTGEVSERTIEDTDEERTDIFANMSVIYAGDTFVNVYTGRMSSNIDADSFEELDWTLGRQLSKTVQEWHDDIVSSEHALNPSSGFIDHLGAWSNRDTSNRRYKNTIDQVQSRINGSFDVRLAYTETLLDEVEADVRDDVADQQEAINAELEELSQEMEVYVEREGLKHTQ
ncbi:hypothetical protein ACFQL3_17460 [Natronoarchaeum sp. GCM10025321]|uniref:hypothetical protein n=2 Tax=unclassified Natronoarchaeum TaxID=2620183 RepID=UPI003607D624